MGSAVVDTVETCVENVVWVDWRVVEAEDGVADDDVIPVPPGSVIRVDTEVSSVEVGWDVVGGGVVAVVGDGVVVVVAKGGVERDQDWSVDEYVDEGKYVDFSVVAVIKVTDECEKEDGSAVAETWVVSGGRVEDGVSGEKDVVSGEKDVVSGEKVVSGLRVERDMA